MSASRVPVEVRFWRHVTPTSDGSCWIWQGKPASTGYGKMGGHHGGRGPMLYAHRVSYELHKGAIPDGLHIDHLCRVRMCVNPDHLEAVTPAINTRRAAPFRPTTRTRVSSHCQRGHSMDDCLVVERSGGRIQRLCRECARVRSLRATRKRRGPLKGRYAPTHCPQGHLYDEGNTYLHGNRRGCRACHAAVERARRATGRAS